MIRHHAIRAGLAVALAFVAVAGCGHGKPAPAHVPSTATVTTPGTKLEITVSTAGWAPTGVDIYLAHVQIKLVGGSDVYDLHDMPWVFVDSGGLRTSPQGYLGVPSLLKVNGSSPGVGSERLRTGDVAEFDLAFDGIDARKASGGRIEFAGGLASWQVV